MTWWGFSPSVSHVTAYRFASAKTAALLPRHSLTYILNSNAPYIPLQEGFNQDELSKLVFHFLKIAFDFSVRVWPEVASYNHFG